MVPNCILDASNQQAADADQMASMEDIIRHLRRHLVGVESLVYLSTVLEKVSRVYFCQTPLLIQTER